MSVPVLLVRHPPVALAWAGRCYGSSDMGWSRAGARMARALADTLAREHATTIVHSGLRRTERLARMIASRNGATLIRDERWRERDFGSWEGRSWHAIWRETGDLMDGMMTRPAQFRPGGGETTAELHQRASAAWDELPSDRPSIVIGHGGSIAAVRAYQAKEDIHDVVRFIPATGEVSRLDRTADPSVRHPRSVGAT